MAAPSIESMSREAIESEIEFWQFYFDECETIGQGISTKEGGRHRALVAALAR